MTFPSFDQYLEPRNLSQLYSLAAQWGSRAKLLAGGTDLLVRLKQRTCMPEALISLKNVAELKTISILEDGILVGSAVKLSDLISSAVFRVDYPLLVEAASKVGEYQQRSMGTIGGNLCLETRCLYFNQSDFARKSLVKCLKAGGEKCYAVSGDKCYAVYSSDTAPALLALKAWVKIGSLAGERWQELSALFTGNGLIPISLKEGEVLTGIFISKEVRTSGGAYLKLAERNSLDFPSLGVAASIALSADKICQNARLALTAAGPSPFLVEGAKDLAGARQISEAFVQKIVDETNNLAVMVRNKTLNVGYRRAMMEKMVGSALKIAWERAEGQREAASQ